MIDATKVRNNFVVINGFLHRKHAKGAKPLTNLQKDHKNRDKLTLWLTFEYQRYRARDVAWAYHYGVWPTCHIRLANGDPMDLNADNLLPCMKTYRFRAKEKNGTYKHPLSAHQWQTLASCFADWEQQALYLYRVQKLRVLALEKGKLQAIEEPILPVKKAKGFKARVSGANLRKTKRPPKIEGRVWCFYLGKWYDLPLASSIEDDIMLRAKRLAEQT